MRQKELLDSIKKSLSRFQAQVILSNSNNEYDINIHAENVVIPILNILYSVNLKNVNYSEGRNTTAIDLIDEINKVAFQVTSTKDIDKIKSTLTKFNGSQFANKVNEVYVYILVQKQSYYTQKKIEKVINGKIKFSVEKNIVDTSDIYRKINELNNLELIEKIEQMLRYQFSDINISKQFSLTQFEEFKNKYRTSCLSNFSRINFFGLSLKSNKPREVELYRLFVYPMFSANHTGQQYHVPIDEINFFKKIIGNEYQINVLDYHNQISLIGNRYETVNSLTNIRVPLRHLEFSHLYEGYIMSILNVDTNTKTSKDIPFSELFSSSKHIAVIGNPGAGKSSFIKYSICKILDKDLSVFENKNIYECIPFRIELHKYNKYKKKKNSNLLGYLNIVLEEEYQINILINDIESILKTFYSIIFFDGLDEVFDIHERIDVRNDIESFLNLYQKVRGIVTSRFESYEEVSMSIRLFSKYTILNFSDDQVTEYVEKWYAIEESTIAARQNEIKNCLSSLEAVDGELKYNPLLLSLILLIYRNELDIPSSKLSIYESCTNTIVETRDNKEKKLDIILKIDNVISVFAALAYWQFNNEKRGESINYNSVENFIKKYLIDKGEFSDDHFAQTAAKEFIEFAKIRSIYFENKFTHKTFLEYFTAYYIFSYYYGNWKKAAELNSIISSCIGLSAWSVVLELLICKIDSNQINYEVIDGIVDYQFEHTPLDALLFFLPIFKYIKNISYNKLKLLILATIVYCFKEGEILKEKNIDHREMLFANLALLYTTHKFKEIIDTCFTEYLVTPSYNKSISDVNYFAYELWIISGNNTPINILSKNNLLLNSEYAFILTNLNSLIDNDNYIQKLIEFIEKFSMEKLSIVYKSLFNQTIFFASNSFNWLISYLCRSDSSSFHESYKSLLKIGIPSEILIKAALKKSAILSVSEQELTILLSRTSEPTYRKFLKILKKTYYPVVKTIQSPQPTKFYDKFYLDMRKKRNTR